jgi:hypothetical protein
LKEPFSNIVIDSINRSSHFFVEIFVYGELVIRFLIFRKLIEYVYCCEEVGKDGVENEDQKREYLHEHEGLGLARLVLPLLPMFLRLFLISSAPEDSAASLVKLTGVSREEHFE